MTIPVLYEAPIMLEKNNFSSVVCRELNLKTKEPDMAEWSRMVETVSYTHLKEIHDFTMIDMWFLEKLNNLLAYEREIKDQPLTHAQYTRWLLYTSRCV